MIPKAILILLFIELLIIYIIMSYKIYKLKEQYLKTLQELVNKEIPKEVIVDDSEYEKYGESSYKCPSCNSWLRPDIFMEKHCCNCGQALKWSEQ